MSKKRKKDTGFTLIELLVTIVVVSLVVSIAVVTINHVMQTAEEKKNEINIATIKRSANQYAEEFKKTDNWSNDRDEENIEYVCTTVGMLINKGILKEKIDGIEYGDGKVISKDTSIKVARDKNTKVYKEEVIFDDDVCMENKEINYNVDVTGVVGNEDWFINNVNGVVSLNSPSRPSDVSEYIYTIKNASNTVVSTNSTTNSSFQVPSSAQGEGMQLCVSLIASYNDVPTPEKCQSFNYDGVAPSVPTIEFTSTKGIISKNSTDNLTSNSEIVYNLDFNDNTKNGNGSVTYNYDSSLLVNNKTVTVTVSDKAGNTNNTSKVVNISEAQNVTPSQVTTYYCDLYPNESYTTQANATSSCKKDVNGTISDTTTYTCSLNTSTTYNDYSTASNNCKEVGTVNTGTGYYCTLDSSFYLSESSVSYCTETRNIGYVSTVLIGQSCWGDTYSRMMWMCSAVPYFCYSWEHFAEQACNPETKMYNKKTYYYCGSDSNNYYFSQSDATTACTTTGTVSSNTKYYCSLNTSVSYTTRANAEANCTTTQTGNTSSKTTYTCALTNQVYNNITDATNACSNHCEIGELYNNKCYDLR